MPRVLAISVVIAAVAAPSSAQAFTAPAPASAALSCPRTVNVTVGDSGDRLFFSKRKVTLRKFQCIRWTWTGVREHRVVTPNGIHSRRRAAPYAFSRSFADPRKKPYVVFCSVHRSMKMKVKVKPPRRR